MCFMDSSSSSKMFVINLCALSFEARCDLKGDKLTTPSEASFSEVPIDVMMCEFELCKRQGDFYGDVAVKLNRVSEF